MAIVWGSKSSLSRLGLELTRTAQTATAETWRVTVYVRTDGYVADNYNNLSLSGAFTYSGSISVNTPVAATLKMYETTKTFTRPLGSNQTQSVSASLTQFAAGSPTVRATFTVASRGYSAPPAPTNQSATLNDDGSIDLAWRIVSTTTAPVQQIYLVRQTNDSDWHYAGATTLKGATSGSLTTKGVSAGNRYRWAIRGENSTANGAFAYTNWVYMPPLAPGNVNVERASAGALNVTWVDRNSYPYAAFEIYHNDAYVGRAAIGATSYSFTPSSTSGSHIVKVRAIRDTMRSEFVAAPALMLSAPPLAPTDLSPDAGYLPTGSSMVLTWRHNPADGTPQTRYEIQYRNVGSYTWYSFTRGSSDSTATITTSDVPSGFNMSTAVEWQVRTRGSHADWSPYSDVASFNFAARPSIVYQSPTSTVTSANFPVTFTVRDSNGATASGASASATLTDSQGNEVAAGGFYGDGPFTLYATDVQPGTYTLRVKASYRVEAFDYTRSISVSYVVVPKPSVTATWDVQTGTLTLAITKGSGGAVDTAKYRMFEWDSYAREWVQRAVSAASPTTTYRTFSTAIQGKPVPWRVVAVAADERVSQPAEIVTEMPEPADFINFGDEVLRIRYRPVMDREAGSAEVKLIDLDNRHPDPIAYISPKDRDMTTVSGLLADYDGTESVLSQVTKAKRLSKHKGLVTLRTFDGDVITGVVSNVRMHRERVGGYTVTFTITQAR